MKTKIKLFLSVSLLVIVSSCTKETVPTATYHEGMTMWCVTSTNDMVPCDQLAAYEENIKLNGRPRLSVTYHRTLCFLTNIWGQSVKGTQCYPSRIYADCGDQHPCEPCGNC